MTSRSMVPGAVDLELYNMCLLPIMFRLNLH